MKQLTIGIDMKPLVAIHLTPATATKDGRPVDMHVLQIALGNGPGIPPTEVRTIATTAQLRTILQRLLQEVGPGVSAPSHRVPGRGQQH